ncbi:hypothetical protein [Aquibacillus rhizosphaerae]|uniref:YtzI protein n=1 Tax=Aquibacillus rhizosphaerae TaxID=3051431 RepID=A0ABT7LBZ0_9BACI|nr:hypothetical protein [Aquibacillus sp. LR5S19]MDL4842095.1 hypothetical protein [Aquibacillus sp. LR5S19]
MVVVIFISVCVIIGILIKSVSGSGNNYQSGDIHSHNHNSSNNSYHSLSDDNHDFFDGGDGGGGSD